MVEWSREEYGILKVWDRGGDMLKIIYIYEEVVMCFRYRLNRCWERLCDSKEVMGIVIGDQFQFEEEVMGIGGGYILVFLDFF